MFSLHLFFGSDFLDESGTAIGTLLLLDFGTSPCFIISTILHRKPDTGNEKLIEELGGWDILILLCDISKFDLNPPNRYFCR